MTLRQQKHIAKIIERQISWTNGWATSDANFTKECRIAAGKISKYLKTRKGKRGPRK